MNKRENKSHWEEIMSKSKKIAGTVEAWENGDLGRDLSHAKKADQALQNQIDASLGMQAISIRLQTELINEFKIIAKVYGIGYQPLMRDALKHFAETELKKIAIEYAKSLPKKKKEETLHELAA